MKYKVALENFTWSRVWKELQSKKNNSLRDIEWWLLKWSCATFHMHLCKHPKVNLVQAMVSVVLKAGHANTQVIVNASTPQRDTPLNNFVLLLIQVCNRFTFVSHTNRYFGS
jgi:hypothetical protein